LITEEGSKSAPGLAASNRRKRTWEEVTAENIESKKVLKIVLHRLPIPSLSGPDVAQKQSKVKASKPKVSPKKLETVAGNLERLQAKDPKSFQPKRPQRVSGAGLGPQPGRKLGVEGQASKTNQSAQARTHVAGNSSKTNPVSML
jgi:hypothetical protein